MINQITSFSTFPSKCEKVNSMNNSPFSCISSLLALLSPQVINLLLNRQRVTLSILRALPWQNKRATIQAQAISFFCWIDNRSLMAALELPRLYQAKPFQKRQIGSLVFLQDSSQKDSKLFQYQSRIRLIIIPSPIYVSCKRAFDITFKLIFKYQ